MSAGPKSAGSDGAPQGTALDEGVLGALRDASATVAAGRAALTQAVSARAAAENAADGARAEEILTEARARARQASADYVAALAALLGEDPARDVARLSSAYPIVFLPVRIETRFATKPKGSDLLVRIYPDEIAADTHEPELTTGELLAGQQFWRRAWDPTRESDAWSELIKSPHAPSRAAWIVRATTPTNVDQRPADAPAFPDVPIRPAAWSRAAESRVLPDRWVAIGYLNGAEVARAVSGLVADPLPLTVHPGADPSNPGDVVPLTPDGLRIDKDVEWTVSFDAALAAGMALRMPLTERIALVGLDRLLIVGVKGSLADDEAGRRLAALLDAHHYTRGVEFVRQGTPTNNTSARRSGYPPVDPIGAVSFAVERGAPRAEAGTVGRQLAEALGLARSVTDHIAGAERRDDDWARAMNELLWPITLGYFLEQMLDPLLDQPAIAAARRFFIDRVRGRGPLPAMRIGAVPYGILPVSSVAAWETRPNAFGADVVVPRVVKELRWRWLQQTDAVARIGRSLDRDQDLIDVLAMDASAREVWVRTVLGGDFEQNMGGLLGLSQSEQNRQWRQAIAGALLSGLATVFGRSLAPDRPPRLVNALFGDDAFRFGHPLVSDAPVSERNALDFNYLRWMRSSASILALAEELVPSGVAPTSLLYRVVRHSLLTLYGGASFDVRVRNGIEVEDARREPELVKIVDGTHTRPTVWDRMREPIPAVSGRLGIGEFLRQTALALRDAIVTGATPSGLSSTIALVPEVTTVASYLAAIEMVEALPTAEIERLFTETLDTCSHRLDAWITSLAAERLREMRGAHAVGAYLGAFGWVEDLRPAPAPDAVRNVPDIGPVAVQNTSGGFIHAPSMTHATAAAVLRNAYLTRSDEGTTRYALNLSSARVRSARQMLDNVREGQSLRALAGYLFERGLHENHPPLELDRFIELFRSAFPLPDVAGTAVADAFSPRAVVDGEAVREAWRNNEIRFWGDTITIATAQPILATVAEQDAIRAELHALDAAVDAVADTLVADAVYQLVRGGNSAAAADLDAVAAGARPPSPEVARAPRSGIPLTHRVGVVLGGAPIEAPGWPAADTPRSAAEPYLDRWIGALIGDAAAVRCSVEIPEPTQAEPHRVRTVEVTLADLHLTPLDLLAVVRSPGSAAATATVAPMDAGPITQGADLERRIADAALGSEAQRGAIRIAYDRAPDWDVAAVRTFPEIRELVRAVADVVGRARAMRPDDLLPPEASGAGSGADPLDYEASGRADVAFAALTAARTGLDEALAALVPGAGDPDLAPLRSRLRGAAAFVAGAYPPPAAPPGMIVRETLVVFARGVYAEMGRRQAAAAAGAAADRMRAIFGRDFVFLPRFRPGAAAELGRAIEYGPTLAPDDDEKVRWLQQAARVRAPLGRWRTLMLYGGCLSAREGAGAKLATFDVAQLPHTEPARWVALPFDAGAPPLARRVSLVLHRAARPAANEPWVGLLLDEWSETIPATVETTGVALHYDNARAEAPNAILIAVPPMNAEHWDLPTVEAILNETLDLAKIRAVDFAVLNDYAQLLPAVYLSSNAASDTISTNFGSARVLEPPIADGG